MKNCFMASKKTVSVICCLGLVIGLVAGFGKGTVAVKAASYPADYRYWCQGASDDASMRAYGCWVTAQAKLLYETGVDRSSGFNPDTYLSWQRSNGLINSGFYQTNGGNAPSIYASQKGKTLTYLGEWNADANQLWFNINAGYYTIVKVYGHYVMLANQLSKEKGTLYCYDSFSDRSSVAPQPLSRYSTWYSGYVYRYDSKDTTPPGISNVKVSNVSATGYTVTCTATDNTGVTKVEFPTWRVSDTSAGCTWYQGSRNGNTWSFTYTGAVFEDNYLTHIYAYDAEGNKSSVSAGVVFCKRQESVYPVVDGGVYEIQSYLSSNKVMDVDSASSKDGANIHLYTRNNSNAQKFKITSVGNGYYKMTAMCSGKAVDVYSAQRTNGANVNQYTYNGTDAQLFRFVNAGNGYCYIISKLGSFVDVKNGSTADGTNIQTWGFGAPANQSWKLNLQEAPATPTPVPTATPVSATSTPKPTAASGATVSTPKPAQTQEPEATTDWDDDSSSGEVVKKPAKVKGVKAKNLRGRKLEVRWEWIADLSGGYQIQYAKSKSFTKGVKTKSVNRFEESKILKGLKRGKTYYVRIRAYNKEEKGKAYGKWSAVKKVKIKK